ncbi:MAG TPA: hypothetical protein VFM22_06580 [Castellaniella sp.]|jgi:hypothetical protein|nr:hypothetical protein [Castellaniella sp.]
MNTPGVGSSLPIDISQAIASGDIQTLIQMVQGERVKLLDQQLVDQVKAVQARNDQIAKLNDVLARLNGYASQIDGTDAGSKPKGWNDSQRRAYEIPLNDAIRRAGITDLGIDSHPGLRTADPGEQPTKDWAYLNAVEIQGHNVINPGVTKGEIDAAITKVKGLIDAESNNQQMDMLRLQSLNNKKNESIEILTNTQKKHTDANSNIIRNF